MLDEEATKQVQAISGTFIYYAHAVDPTILPALNEISNRQAKPTEKYNESMQTTYGLFIHISCYTF